MQNQVAVKPSRIVCNKGGTLVAFALKNLSSALDSLDRGPQTALSVPETMHIPEKGPASAASDQRFQSHKRLLFYHSYQDP